MITLYAFGPGFGMPDPSPFVTKAEVLLKMAGLAYRTDTTGFRKAPKGKLPYIDDNGQRIADSTFIRWHLERKYQVDFDKGVSAEQRAIGWAFEKMAEDNLYWALVDARWFDEDNFAKGPVNFFRSIPAPMRPLIIAFVRRQLRRALHGQGMGRHTRAEIEPSAPARLTPLPIISAASPSSWAPSRPASMRRSSPSSPARCAPCSRRPCAPPPNAATICVAMWAAWHPAITRK
jgi:Glutathione S-transferase N-terminal domain